MRHVTEEDPKHPNIKSIHTIYTRDELISFWDEGPTTPEESPDWDMMEYIQFTAINRNQAVVLSALFQKWILANRNAVHWAKSILTFWLVEKAEYSANEQGHIDHLKERCKSLVRNRRRYLEAGCFVDDHEFIEEARGFGELL